MKWILTATAKAAMTPVDDESMTTNDGFGSSGGFWYDITDGGYFRPSDVIGDSAQLEQVTEAIALLRDLERNVYDKIVDEY